MKTVFASPLFLFALTLALCIPTISSAENIAATNSAKVETNDDNEPIHVVYPPIRHYLAGEGESLERDKNLQEQALAHFKIDKSQFKSDGRAKIAREKAVAKLKKYFETPNDRVLPCFENKTVRTEFSFALKMDPETVISDYLFLTPTDVPKNGIGAFGQRVMTFVYDLQDPKSPVIDIAHGMSVPCFPFRRRATAKYVYEHFGKEALRNFDTTKEQVIKVGDKKL